MSQVVPSCMNCLYFSSVVLRATDRVKFGKDLPMLDDKLELLGHCRRHAPQLYSRELIYQLNPWPFVTENSWCGDWSVK